MVSFYVLSFAWTAKFPRGQIFSWPAKFPRGPVFSWSTMFPHAPLFYLTSYQKPPRTHEFLRHVTLSDHVTKLNTTVKTLTQRTPITITDFPRKYCRATHNCDKYTNFS